MGSNKLNSNRILWQNNTLNELKSLLGEDIEIDVEESLFASELDFPWPVTVSSVDIKTDSQGETWVSMIISFDAIDGATKYQVRFSPFEKSLDIAFSVDIESDPTLPENIVEGMVGFVFAHGAITSLSGGFNTWEQIYEGSDIDPFDTLGRRLRVYKGTGVSDLAPGEVSYTDSGAWKGIALVVFRDCSDDITVSPLSESNYNSSGTPVSDPITVSGSAEPGSIVINVIRASEGSGDCYPGDGSLYIDNGFSSATHVRSPETIDLVYTHSLALSVGKADGGAFSTAFDMVEIDGQVQAAAFILSESISSAPPESAPPLPPEIYIPPEGRFSTRLAVGVNEDIWEKSTTSPADTITTAIRSDGTRVFRATAGDHAPNSNNSTFARYRARLPEKYGIAPNGRFWISAKVNLLTSATHYYSFLRSDNYVATLKGTSTKVGCAGGNEWRTGIAMQPGNEIELITTHQNNSTTVLWSGTLTPGIHDVAFMIDPKADSSGSWSITIDGVTNSGTGQTIPSSVPLSERYVTRVVTCIDGANNWTDTALQVEVEECIFESEI